MAKIIAIIAVLIILLIIVFYYYSCDKSALFVQCATAVAIIAGITTKILLNSNDAKYGGAGHGSHSRWVSSSSKKSSFPSPPLPLPVIDINDADVAPFLHHIMTSVGSSSSSRESDHTFLNDILWQINNKNLYSHIFMPESTANDEIELRIINPINPAEEYPRFKYTVQENLVRYFFKVCGTNDILEIMKNFPRGTYYNQLANDYFIVSRGKFFVNRINDGKRLLPSIKYNDVLGEYNNLHVNNNIAFKNDVDIGEVDKIDISTYVAHFGDTTKKNYSKVAQYKLIPLNNIYINIDQVFYRYDEHSIDLDGYNPLQDIAFETDGIFHYYPTDDFLSLRTLVNYYTGRFNDLEKERLCKSNGICLIRIPVFWNTFNRHTDEESKIKLHGDDKSINAYYNHNNTLLFYYTISRLFDIGLLSKKYYEIYLKPIPNPNDSGKLASNYIPHHIFEPVDYEYIKDIKSHGKKPFAFDSSGIFPPNPKYKVTPKPQSTIYEKEYKYYFSEFEYKNTKSIEQDYTLDNLEKAKALDHFIDINIGKTFPMTHCGLIRDHFKGFNEKNIYPFPEEYSRDKINELIKNDKRIKSIKSLSSDEEKAIQKDRVSNLLYARWNGDKLYADEKYDYDAFRINQRFNDNTKYYANLYKEARNGIIDKLLKECIFPYDNYYKDYSHYYDKNGYCTRTKSSMLANVLDTYNWNCAVHPDEINEATLYSKYGEDAKKADHVSKATKCIYFENKLNVDDNRLNSLRSKFDNMLLHDYFLILHIQPIEPPKTGKGTRTIIDKNHPVYINISPDGDCFKINSATYNGSDQERISKSDKFKYEDDYNITNRYPSKKVFEKVKVAGKQYICDQRIFRVKIYRSLYEFAVNANNIIKKDNYNFVNATKDAVHHNIATDGRRNIRYKILTMEESNKYYHESGNRNIKSYSDIVRHYGINKDPSAIKIFKVPENLIHKERRDIDDDRDFKKPRPSTD